MGQKQLFLGCTCVKCASPLRFIAIKAASVSVMCFITFISASRLDHDHMIIIHKSL